MKLSKVKRNLAAVLVCFLVMTSILPSYARSGALKENTDDSLILDEDEVYYESDTDTVTATSSNMYQASPSDQRSMPVATPSQALADAVRSFNREVVFVNRNGDKLSEGDSLEIPDTGKSFPYLSQEKGRTKGKLDLEDYGYEEAEYFLSGIANVYDIQDDKLATKSDADYVNRVIVFRPESVGDFNGVVFVDILNASSKVDVPDIWRRSYDYFMTHGYAYVGITSKDVNVNALKAFDPSRYDVLDWKDRSGTSENGLFWDMLGQLGVLLKADDSPLLYGDETGVERYSYLMGQSQSGWYVNTFSNRFSKANYVVEDMDSIENVEDIKGDTHIFDGFMNVVGGMMDAPIANKQSDNALMFEPVKKSDVPFILLVGENDYNPAPVRENSDEEGNRYRHYVIAGGSHSNKIFLPDPIDEIQLRAGRPAGDYPPYHMDSETGRPNTRSDMNIDVFVNAALENLHQWVSEDIPAPYGPLADEIEGSIKGFAFVPERDDYGNMTTGIRSPQLTVPVASYYGGANGVYGTDGGSMIYLDDTDIANLYEDRDDYLNKFETALDEAIDDRWILLSDKALMMKLAQEEPIFDNPGRDDEAVREAMREIPDITELSGARVDGYRDTEYLISGNANLYGILRDNIIYKRRMYTLPYENYARVCIPQNFSGDIILDLITGGEPEKDMTDYMRAKTAYIGITATPELAKAKGGSWEIPYKTGQPRMESGLVWDIISQTVTAVRNSELLGDFTGKTLNIQLGQDYADADMAYTYKLVFEKSEAYGVNLLGSNGNGKPIPLNSLDSTIPNTVSQTEDDGKRYQSNRDSEDTGSQNDGNWIWNGTVWWFQFRDGTWPVNQWMYLEWNGFDNWYFFNTEGYMVTGWLEYDGNRYYLHPVSDGTQGYLYTGWHLIDGTWYYFNEVSDGTKGRLLTNVTTADGYAS